MNNNTSYHKISSTMHTYSEPMATDPNAGEPVNQIMNCRPMCISRSKIAILLPIFMTTNESLNGSILIFVSDHLHVHYNLFIFFTVYLFFHSRENLERHRTLLIISTNRRRWALLVNFNDDFLFNEPINRVVIWHTES